MGTSAAAKAADNGLLKFIIYTEIPEEDLSEVLSDQEQISKCDVIALLYENEKDHIEFLRENINKLPKLIPKILI